MSADRPLLRVRNLGVTFHTDTGPVRAVDDISFDVAEGQILGLVGESGSGKSVSTRALMQLLPRSARLDPATEMVLRLGTNGNGTGEKGGDEQADEKADEQVDIASLGRRHRRMQSIRGGEIAMIFQEPMASFAPTYRIGDPIMEAARLHTGVDKRTARTVALDLLERVGISEPTRRIEQYPFELSGGMRQRVMIAVALASQPRLLIADEPTTALDVTIQAQILDLLRELRRDLDMAIVFITHDLGVISQIADDVAVMYLGRIVEQGSVRDVITDPAHPYTVKLLEAIPRLDRLNSRLASIGGEIPGAAARPSGCVFHTRCDRVIEGRCGAEVPGPIELSPTHRVACLLHEPGGPEPSAVPAGAAATGAGGPDPADEEPGA